MTGLVWFVQIVHYPLFPWVGGKSFADYEAEHTRRTTLVVGPVMLAELASALALLAFQPPGVPAWALWLGMLLLLVCWLVTFFVSVPCHGNLARGFDPQAARKLVRTNWFRTAAWTIRAFLATAMVFYWPSR